MNVLNLPLASETASPFNPERTSSQSIKSPCNGNGHWIIAGTGRAGTTFLVRYLAELGFDTHLAHNGSAQYDEEANAGFEDFALVGDMTKLPKVVKSPWLSEYIEEVLRHPDFPIDLAILPVRDLSVAATSRIVLEMRARSENQEWLSSLETTWENWGHVPGGAVFSLHPLDQARVLAVSFHRMVHRLVEAGIPLLFLEFPRFIKDGDHLLRQLRPHLPHTITDEAAREAHCRVADLHKVRIEHEMDMGPGFESSCVQAENIALKREVRRLQAENHRLRDQRWWQRLWHHS
jgi:hypothetical protein